MAELNFRCPKRLKGQRYDKRMIPLLIFERGDKLEVMFPIGEFEESFGKSAKLVVLGEFTSCFEGVEEPAQHLEIEYDGWVIPAWRRLEKFGDTTSDYVICQAYSRKAVKV